MENSILIISTLLTPILMIGFGRVFRKNPPKDINEVYGYRTMRSMKNQETWDFAHQHCGKIWTRVGSIMLIVTIILDIILIVEKEKLMIPKEEIMLAELFVQICILILTIFPTERALKNNFDEQGNPIQKVEEEK